MDTGNSVQFFHAPVSGGPDRDVNYVSVMINKEKYYLHHELLPIPQESM